MKILIYVLVGALSVGSCFAGKCYGVVIQGSCTGVHTNSHEKSQDEKK